MWHPRKIKQKITQHICFGVEPQKLRTSRNEPDTFFPTLHAAAINFFNRTYSLADPFSRGLMCQIERTLLITAQGTTHEQINDEMKYQE